MLEEPEDNRLDQSLRDLFSEFDLPPARHVWTGIEEKLSNMPPPVLPVRKRRLVPVPFLLVLVGLIAGLAGWLLPHPNQSVKQELSTVTRQTSVPAASKTEVATATAPNTTAHYAQRATAAGQKAVAQAQRNSTTPSSGSSAESARRAVAQNNSSVAAHTASSVKNTRNSSPAAPTAVAKASVVQAAVVAAVPAQEETASATAATGSPVAAVSSTAKGDDNVPASLRLLVTLEKSVQAEPSVVVSAEAARAQKIAALRAQRNELLRLRIHTDSLLVVLGDVPVVVPTAEAVAATPTTEAADTTKPTALDHRWSLQLAAAPEQNALSLDAADDDTFNSLRRGHETGRTGVSAHLMAEYRLNQRVSVGAGLGYNTFGAELRINHRRTEVDVTYQTTTTTTTTAATSTNQSYSIRITQVPMQNPIFNSNGQVIGYDTVYTTRQDTLFTTTVLHDTLRTTVNNTTPILTRREVSSNTTLRPNYHFITLPVLVRYRITPRGNTRWWTDIALGAQLQLFMGGTQAVTDDGVNFRTESISAGAGPFRPVNLALSGSLALNYALSDRLSLSVAPSLRWQALSIYKSETGLKQQATATGLQLGVRWRL